MAYDIDLVSGTRSFDDYRADPWLVQNCADDNLLMVLANGTLFRDARLITEWATGKRPVGADVTSGATVSYVCDYETMPGGGGWDKRYLVFIALIIPVGIILIVVAGWISIQCDDCANERKRKREDKEHQAWINECKKKEKEEAEQNRKAEEVRVRAVKLAPPKKKLYMRKGNQDLGQNSQYLRFLVRFFDNDAIVDQATRYWIKERFPHVAKEAHAADKREDRAIVDFLIQQVTARHGELEILKEVYPDAYRDYFEEVSPSSVYVGV